MPTRPATAAKPTASMPRRAAAPVACTYGAEEEVVVVADTADRVGDTVVYVPGGHATVLLALA